MSLQFTRRTQATHLRLLGTTCLLLALGACGGGGGSPGAVGNGPNPAPNDVTVTMTLVDGSGAAITNLAFGQTGTVRAKVLDVTGAIAPSAIVRFRSDAALVVFVPDSASALTDAAGVATITVKPASAGAAGAAGIVGETSVGGKTGTGTVNLSVGPAR